jgi:hypothetical protein
MLTLRPEQMAAFDAEVRKAFITEMVAHCQEFSPRLCDTAGTPQARLLIEWCIDDAQDYGFTNRGPVRLFIELALLLGIGFHTDPQYPRVAAILRSKAEQMERAEALHAHINDYQRAVVVADDSAIHRSLVRLSSLLQQDPAMGPGSYDAAARSWLSTIYPEKVADAGEDVISKLCDSARAVARELFGTEDRSAFLVLGLMFGFGHGCLDDPMYPWIGRTARDERFGNPSERAYRLERKARTWLREALARWED